MFSIGQRWLNSQQPELGLGIVTQCNARQISIFFPLVQKDAIYASENAPLIRLILDVGDTAMDVHHQVFEVINVDNSHDFITYHVRYEDTEEAHIAETQLAHSTQINQPEKRLFSMQVDAPRWFALRRELFQLTRQHRLDDALGIVGTRALSLEHQINIVQQVGNRFAPRALLADEVGLGKTLEALMILTKQRLRGHCSRALIVVPNALQNQWLVECQRRINMRFSLYDEARVSSLREEGINPWLSDQWILCSQDTLSAVFDEQLLDVDWDMLIVDEAHHLQWSPEQSSDNYQRILALSEKAKGVLLLSATPDQLGETSLFAQLKLLDSARFNDLTTFIAEQSQYKRLADATQRLLDAGKTPELCSTLAPLLSDLTEDEIETASMGELIQIMLDRHGTGRLFYRNTRDAVGYFAHRTALAFELNCDDDHYQSRAQAQLYPHEQENASWLECDPRVQWLIDMLPSAGAKILLICRSALTSILLSQYLFQKTGKRYPVFNETMSIIERDRAAHFFADEEEGAQLLICSEIGSEGRNFQFCKDLILFDLPSNPDLLEQRIGRLDRIGQSGNINIHIPVITNSKQARLYAVFNHGLNAFEHTCNVGNLAIAQAGCLETALTAASDKFEHYLGEVKRTKILLEAERQQGRDKLLEINAKGTESNEALLAALDSEVHSEAMADLLTLLADCVGLKIDVNDNDSFILTQTEDLLFALSQLPEDGLTYTLSKKVACKREDLEYITLEHPLIEEMIANLLSQQQGRASVAFISEPELPAGAFWVQCHYILLMASETDTSPFLLPISFCVNADYAGNIVNFEPESVARVKKSIVSKVLMVLHDQIQDALAVADAHAQTISAKYRDDALATLEANLGAEITRLEKLQQINPSVSEADIAPIRQEKTLASTMIEQAPLQLDALRILVNNPK